MGTGRRVPPGGRATAELKAASSRGHCSPPSRLRRRCDGLVAAPAPAALAAAVAAGGPRRNAVVLAGSTPRGDGPLPGSVGGAAGGPAGTRAPGGGRPLLSSHRPPPRRRPPGSREDLTRGEGVATPSPTPPFNPALWPYFLFPFAFLSGVRVPQLSPTPSSRNPLLPSRCIEHQLCTSGARIRVSSFRPGEGSPDQLSCRPLATGTHRGCVSFREERAFFWSGVSRCPGG